MECQVGLAHGWVFTLWHIWKTIFLLASYSHPLQSTTVDVHAGSGDPVEFWFDLWFDFFLFLRPVKLCFHHNLVEFWFAFWFCFCFCIQYNSTFAKATNCYCCLGERGRTRAPLFSLFQLGFVWRICFPDLFPVSLFGSNLGLL
jgi:hypothetical protein